MRQSLYHESLPITWVHVYTVVPWLVQKIRPSKVVHPKCQYFVYWWSFIGGLYYQNIRMAVKIFTVAKHLIHISSPIPILYVYPIFDKRISKKEIWLIFFSSNLFFTFLRFSGFFMYFFCLDHFRFIETIQIFIIFYVFLFCFSILIYWDFLNDYYFFF